VGKDSALALHEVRSAGQVEITGLLNHGERNRQASGSVEQAGRTLQARDRWFARTCPHQVLRLDGLYNR
jgi:hypothetical protein